MMKSHLKKLRPIMEAYNWSTADVADFCNVTRAAAHCWINGRHVPTPENLQSLAKLFRVRFVVDANGIDILGPEAYKVTKEEGDT